MQNRFIHSSFLKESKHEPQNVCTYLLLRATLTRLDYRIAPPLRHRPKEIHAALSNAIRDPA
jgi:hypothetical protein